MLTSAVLLTKGQNSSNKKNTWHIPVVKHGICVVVTAFHRASTCFRNSKMFLSRVTIYIDGYYSGMHTKVTPALSFLLLTGILRCDDLLLLQQQRKHAFHIMPPLVYIKLTPYRSQRASFPWPHLSSFLYRVTWLAKLCFSTTEPFLCSCGPIAGVIQTGS